MEYLRFITSQMLGKLFFNNLIDHNSITVLTNYYIPQNHQYGYNNQGKFNQVIQIFI